MNILYIHQYFKFPNENGGTRSYDLAKSFQGKGYKTTIITSTSEPPLKGKKRWNIVQKEGLTIHYIFLPYSNKLSYLKRTQLFLCFLWYTTLHILTLKTDLLLATSTPLTVGIPALLKKWLHKTPFIFEVRDVWPEAVVAIGAIKNKILIKILYFLEKIIYRNAAIIVPLSTDMQASIDQRYPKMIHKTQTVIPNIAEINRFKKIESSCIISKTIGFKPRISVLYAGTIGKVNGIEYLIDMASKTFDIDKKIVYIILGEGGEKEKIIACAKEKNVLNKNVFILDAVNKEMLPEWYAAASIGCSFVINIKELWANSANKFFDTLAAKRPVLINYEGWQKEIIEHNDIGFVLPAILTPQSIANFVQYTQNEEHLKTQGNKALQYAIKEYALSCASQKYIIIFERIKKKEGYV